MFVSSTLHAPIRTEGQSDLVGETLTRATSKGPVGCHANVADPQARSEAVTDGREVSFGGTAPDGFAGRRVDRSDHHQSVIACQPDAGVVGQGVCR